VCKLNSEKRKKDPRMEAIIVDELCQPCGFILVLKTLSGFVLLFNMFFLIG